jgi:flagellar biosynthesis protein FlhB
MAEHKSEQPTQRKLEKARKDGRFPISRQFVGACQFVVFVWLMGTYGAVWFRGAAESFRSTLVAGFRPELTPTTVVHLFWTLGVTNLVPLLATGLVLSAAIVVAQIFSTNFGITLKKLAPDLKRLNPIPRLKQLPEQNIPIFLQALLLLPLFGFAVWAIMTENLGAFARLPLTTAWAGAERLGEAVMSLLWRAATVFVLFGLVDLFRQRKKHAQGLRMTKQEIRDEMKETEGNPLIKQRIRRIQRDAARRSMIKQIPTATAVVVNPTHYAVALRYSMETAGAPVVVAKGKNYLARRIREIATDHNIPIVENQPLAQALYKSVEVGQEIPAHLYRAVAEILGYIYRLMNGRLPG